MQSEALDHRAWESIDGLLRPFISRRVAAPEDADDILQEVLIRVHRGLPALRDEEQVAAWMYRIARNAVIDHLRRRPREMPAIEPEIAEAPVTEENDAADVMARALSFFIVELPSPYREAITLTELEGRTQREAAEMVGISLSGMKSRVQRGRARLRLRPATRDRTPCAGAGTSSRTG